MIWLGQLELLLNDICEGYFFLLSYLLLLGYKLNVAHKLFYQFSNIKSQKLRLQNNRMYSETIVNFSLVYVKYFKTVTVNHLFHLIFALFHVKTRGWFIFFKIILLIMLLQLSQFFLPIIPLCLAPPLHQHSPTLVHVHGSHI